MNANNKPFFLMAAAIAALFAISVVVRFVALSQMGLPGGWMLVLFLPAGGIGLLVVLLRLGVLTSLNQNLSAFNPAPPAPTKAQRLQEIENLRVSGALSDDEYTAERGRIISSI